MKIKRVFLASDHAGFVLKQKISKFLISKGIKILDLGTKNKGSVDYPDFAHLLARKMKPKDNNIGILVCGSGVGMSMSANRHKKIRAALCYSVKNAKLSRLHNDANIITLGSRFINKRLAFNCIKFYLNTNFEGGRHKKRVKKI